MTHEHERRTDLLPLSADETKDVMKEALKEWLDEKFAQFGIFSFTSIAAAALCAAAYFILRANGWHKGP